MTFKEFLKINEEQSGSDRGLMGFPVQYFARKPSDGRPFKNLGPVAGAQPRGGSGGGGAMMSGGGGRMMMKKMMKKA